jgi:two-component system, NtrC family, response regulator AtoC
MPFRAGDLPPDEIIFGPSAVMQAIRQRVEKIAPANVPVLIQGENGTGKGVLARYIHNRSSVSDGPFVKVNCAAIPSTLLESELFGYDRGAFTGAYTGKAGRVESANGGTLFLDGIDEIDSGMQAKLLQLLQDGQFSRIGGREDIQVTTRVICATNRPLATEIAAGRFRQDLYYRINVVDIELPTLRLRIEDVADLANYFLVRHRCRHQTTVTSISPSMLRLLQRHSWPGNIRELENLVERYVILGSEEAISAEILQWDRTHVASEIPANRPIHLKSVTRQAVQELERKIILNVLEANRWNRKRAASELKISYRALLYKIREAGIPQKRSRIRPVGKDPLQVPAQD